jgi:hypothetical protein
MLEPVPQSPRFEVRATTTLVRLRLISLTHLDRTASVAALPSGLQWASVSVSLIGRANADTEFSLGAALQETLACPRHPNDLIPSNRRLIRRRSCTLQDEHTF